MAAVVAEAGGGRRGCGAGAAGAAAAAGAVEWAEVEEQHEVAPSVRVDVKQRLLHAVRFGDTLELRGLVRRGAPLEMNCAELPSGRGNLLDWALHHQKPEVALRLLRLADSVGMAGQLARGARFAVHLAAQGGDVELLKMLLGHGADPCQRGPPCEGVEPRSALLAAAAHGRAAAVAALVEAGALKKETKEAEVRRYACSGDFLGALGVEVSKTLPTGPPMEELRAQLQAAILAEDHVAVHTSVGRGALLLPHYRTDKAFPKAGPGFRSTSSYVTGDEASRHAVLVNPVDWAALENRPLAALWLLELGDWAEIAGALHPEHDRLAPNTVAAVHTAARRGAPPAWGRLLRELLSRGADAAQADPHGRSALHLAVLNGNVEAAEMLLEHGAWKRELQGDEVIRLATGRRMAAVLSAAGVALDGGGGGSGSNKPAAHPVSAVSAAAAAGAASTSTETAREASVEISLLRQQQQQQQPQQPQLSASARPSPDESPSPLGLRLFSQLSIHDSDLRRSPCETAAARPASELVAWHPHPSPPPPARAAAPAVGTEAPLAHTLREAQTQEELNAALLQLRREVVKAVRWADLTALRATLLRGARLHPQEVELDYGIRGNLVDLAVWHEREATAVAVLELADGQGTGQDVARAALHAVFWAVRHNYLDLLRALLDRGADPARRDEVAGSPLRAAVEQSRADAAALLLAAGAWEREGEKELVLELLKDRGLLAPFQEGSGRGLGNAEEKSRYRLLVAAAKALPPHAVGVTASVAAH